MNNKYIIIAGYLGALTVALGAFGAHTLKTMLSPAAMEIFETGIKYQFIHVLALLAVGIMYKQQQGKNLVWAARLFILGIILFSGSLYALSVIITSGNNSFRWVGAITPLGGVGFIAGWVMLAKRKPPPRPKADL